MQMLDPSLASSPPMEPSDGFQTGKMAIANFIRTGQLPSPALGVLDQIELAVRQLNRTQALKERLCEYILSEVSELDSNSSVRNLLTGDFRTISGKLFRYLVSRRISRISTTSMQYAALCKQYVCATLHLHRCSLRLATVMLNDHNLYDHILEDELFFDVLGMLECTQLLTLLEPFLTLTVR